ncbi:hypothetical protein D1007_56488 [Hordeum vulgare]|nr:hypothetical protein D1007_56488 [Hordeum vulgare]
MAMAAEGTSRRRILDYLNNGEKFGLEGPSSTAAAATPRALAAARSLLPRFPLGRGSPGSPKGRADQGGARGGDRSPPRRMRRACSGTPLQSSVACAVAVVAVAAARRRGPSGLSVGLSLVFLLAKTSDEFDKMARV